MNKILKHYITILYNKLQSVSIHTGGSSLFRAPARAWYRFRCKLNLAIRFQTDVSGIYDIRGRAFLFVKAFLKEDGASRPYNDNAINRIKSVIRRGIGFPVIYNVQNVNEPAYSKRALLIYLTKPFLYESDDSELIRHQNNRRCVYISAILDELGYIVDAVDINDKYFRPSRHYDLVISARNNLFKMDDYFDDNVIRIYIATSLYHPLHNSNIRRRHELLYERRGRGVELRRIYPESMPFVKNANAIIAVGNEFITRTWHEALNVPVYPFNNFGWRETEFFIDRKDFSSARRNFLFFASRSQTQKGLDLLLEIFPKHTDLHLYICSEFAKERDFCTCYHKELYETPNIHPIGWIKVNGPKYNDLVKKCAFVIHPTCSEGQPGSVVQCMYSGLIPLVTKESGIDTEDFGKTFADDSLEEIEKVILEVSRLPESWHRERSSRTRRVSEMKYSEDALVERWRNILAEVLNRAAK